MSENLFEFTANIDCSLANAIRRTIISRVPSIVIDTVCIEENDSSLCSEMIAHRLGLIPLKKTDQNLNNELIVELNKTGPCRVYSRDIIFPPGIKAVSPDIIILNLAADECIKLTGKTEEGCAAEQNHSKFSVSCGKTAYKKTPNGLIHFKVETTGCVPAKEAIIKAIKIIKDDFLMYKKLL